jgi:hypothetical protein
MACLNPCLLQKFIIDFSEVEELSAAAPTTMLQEALALGTHSKSGQYELALGAWESGQHKPSVHAV